jgi:hypothetical protein
MKKKSGKILGIVLTLVLLVSLTIAAVPVMAITQPQVLLTPTTIQATATYTIRFTAGEVINGAAGDQIIIRFSTGTTVLSTPMTTIEALTGIGGGPISPAAAPGGGAVGVPATAKVIMTLGAGQSVGAGSLVQLIITGITNPATPGAYTLTVASQTAAGIPIEAAVTSAEYVISPPLIMPLPGVVQAYNSVGILMCQSMSINTCIAAAGVRGRVEVGPGTYDEDVIANVAGQSIIATGNPGTVIISDANNNGFGGTITVNSPPAVPNTGITIDGFVVKPGSIIAYSTMLTVTNISDFTIIKNCQITSGTVSGITSAAGADNITVNNCALITKGVSATGVISNGSTKIIGCRFSGTSGNGLQITGINNMIVNSIFNNIINAIQITATSTNNLLVNNTIVSNSGYGIQVVSGSTGNVITNSILWDNGNDLDGDTATYSDISDGDAGEGNITQIPLFVDSANNDYHLQAESPCLDTGNNTIIITGAINSDIEGNPRILDGDLNGTATVDMGAYEYSPFSAIPVEDISFHGVEVGSSLDQTTTLYNTGTGVLTVNSIMRQKGSSEYTVISPVTPFDIQPGESRQITVRYSPTSETGSNATFSIGTSPNAVITFDTYGYGVVLLYDTGGGLTGDVNGDGNVNVLDITKVARIILGRE